MSWDPSGVAICGLDELAAWDDAPPTHVLSLLDPAHPEPDSLKQRRPQTWTLMRFDDIIAPAEGKVMPRPQDIRAILDLGPVMADPQARLLVHCHMGVSRSTAATLALLAQARPRTDEDSLLHMLHALRPQAWPNSLMVRWTDDILGRQGRLVAALGRHYARQIAADPRYPRWMRLLHRDAELDLAGYKVTA